MSARSWDFDRCACGHIRTEHRPGKRLPWPETGRGMRGACTSSDGCGCRKWEIDTHLLEISGELTDGR